MLLPACSHLCRCVCRGPGLQQRTDLAALSKQQYAKVAYARCCELCVFHTHKALAGFFLTTSDFLDQELLRYITVYHMCIMHCGKQYLIMQIKCLQSPLQHIPAASCYCSSSKCMTLLTGVFLLLTQKYIISAMKLPLLSCKSDNSVRTAF